MEYHEEQFREWAHIALEDGLDAYDAIMSGLAAGIAMFSDDDLMNRPVLKGRNALDIAYLMEFIEIAQSPVRNEGVRVVTGQVLPALLSALWHKYGHVFLTFRDCRGLPSDELEARQEPIKIRGRERGLQAATIP